uniref:Uncharacterized protein n=1 Tax=Cacopsylla melanoneura TaxID=428564 RepID=A0A8D8WSB0_9HEMI
MECAPLNRSSPDVLNRVGVISCPHTLFNEDSNKSYCCHRNEMSYCCNLSEYIPLFIWEHLMMSAMLFTLFLLIVFLICIYCRRTCSKLCPNCKRMCLDLR